MIYILIPTTKERRHRLETCLESIRKSECSEPFTVCIYENDTDGGWGKALLKMIKWINGIVFLLSDDMVVDKDCIQNLYDKYIENFPNFDGMAQPFDNFGAGMNGDSPFLHTDILRPFLELGYSHYADKELAYVMHKENKYLVVPEAKITHIHMTEFPELEDETYRKAHSFAKDDLRLFNSRIKNI